MNKKSEIRKARLAKKKEMNERFGKFAITNQEHDEIMRSIGHSNSSEEFGGQEHSCIMDAILGRGDK